MDNKGLRQYRLKSNPTEEIFARVWEEYNERYPQFLEYLLSEEINKPYGEVSERDRMVAATIIQWLGSPVGMDFRRTVGSEIVEENCNYQRTAKDVRGEEYD